MPIHWSTKRSTSSAVTSTPAAAALAGQDGQPRGAAGVARRQQGARVVQGGLQVEGGEVGVGEGVAQPLAHGRGGGEGRHVAFPAQRVDGGDGGVQALLRGDGGAAAGARAGEVLHRVEPALRAGGEAEAEVGEARIEDVLAVPLAAHPALLQALDPRGFDGWRAAGAAGDVLGNPLRPAAAGGEVAVEHRLAARCDVAVVGARQHVLGMGLGGGGQSRVRLQRRQVMGLAGGGDGGQCRLAQGLQIGCPGGQGGDQQHQQKRQKKVGTHEVSPAAGARFHNSPPGGAVAGQLAVTTRWLERPGWPVRVKRETSAAGLPKNQPWP
nr:hypothetical protein [Caenispirillum bisanense]